MYNLRPGWFLYNGVPMPNEFSEVCKVYKKQSEILKRGENKYSPYGWRLYPHFANFLKYTYKGDLPNTVEKLAKKFKYPQHLQDLFNETMSEEGYKNVYPDEYAEFFANRTPDEQSNIFHVADCGGRTIYEMMQDVTAGNLYEDMLCYYSNGLLIPNNEASGRGTNKLNRKCDLIYTKLHLPLEIKTRWEKDYKVKVKGTGDKIVETGGMVFAAFINLGKGVVIDFAYGNDVKTKGTMCIFKETTEIKANPDDCFDFRFWVKEDMEHMFSIIDSLYEERKNKRDL